MVSPDAGGAPPYRYTAVLAAELERRWQDRWEADGTFETANPVGALASGAGVGSRPKLYLLDMFPYPSAYGLHVGHPLGYIGTDVFGRYHRMAGSNVLHTLGFDAFGLPAEQYAVQQGQHPRTTTEANVANYRRQLRRLGLAHDPRRSIATTDPAYYRWTQWIFTQIFEAWYDADAGRARPIAELIEELTSGHGRPPTAARGRTCRQRSSRRSSIAIGSRTWPTARSTGAQGSARCWPMRRSPPTGAATSATSRCSAALCGSGCCASPPTPTDCWTTLTPWTWPESIKTMQRNWIGRSDGARIRFPTSAGPDRGLHHPTRHRVRRHLFGAGAGAPAARWAAAAGLAGRHPAKLAGRGRQPREAVAGYRQAAASKTDRERQQSRVKTGVFTGAWPPTRPPAPRSRCSSPITC